MQIDLEVKMKFFKNNSKSINGFTLVELLIGMLISLFLTAGVIQVYSSTSQVSQKAEEQAAQQEVLYFVTNYLRKEIRSAQIERDTNNNFRFFKENSSGIRHHYTYGINDEGLLQELPYQVGGLSIDTTKAKTIAAICKNELCSKDGEGEGEEFKLLKIKSIYYFNGSAYKDCSDSNDLNGKDLTGNCNTFNSSSSLVGLDIIVPFDFNLENPEEYKKVINITMTMASRITIVNLNPSRSINKYNEE